MTQLQNQFEKLVSRYHGYLWVIASASIGTGLQGKLDALDVVQATFLKAHRGFDDLRGSDDASVAAWLRKILVSVLTDEFRRLHREKRNIAREFAVSARVDSTATGMEHWLAADLTSPSMCVAKNERLLHLAESLLKLSDEQREVVILKHIRGHTLQQISEETERSVPAVAGLLRRGLEKLRAIMPPD